MVIESYPKAKKIAIVKENRTIDHEVIKELHEDKGWSIEYMCRELKISRAAYYKWLHRKPSKLDIENEVILDTIKDIAEGNNSLFGAQKMTYVINRRLGKTYNHKRITRLMCVNDIKSNFRRKKRHNYRRSTPEFTADNLLDRDFSTERPNEKWCTDVTELPIPGTTKKLYLSPVIDLYDDTVFHHEVSRRNDNRLAFDTIDGAHAKEPDARPILHDDRGFQYTSPIFKAKLDEYGITHSMSRVSKCIDNGPCESVQGIIKDMLYVLHPDIKTEEDMIKAINHTIKYYNEEYPKKRFKGKTPAEVRKEGLKSKTPTIYPIPKNLKIERFWQRIEASKQRQTIR